MNRKQRAFAQIMVLLYLATGVIAACDYLDKKNSEEIIERNNVQNSINRQMAKTNNTYSEKDRFEKDEAVLYFSIDRCGCDWIPYSDVTTEYVECPIEPIFDNDDIETNNCTFETLPLPYGDSSFLMFMDYRTLTDTTSRQWELQQYAWTDSDGFRRIGDDYCVALGTIYGEIGDRFRITTDKGNTYTAIMSDAKGSDAVFYDDIHSWYHYAGNGCNVVEFVVQTEYLPSAVTISGSCGAVDYLSGNIVSIERI